MAQSKFFKVLTTKYQIESYQGIVIPVFKKKDSLPSPEKFLEPILGKKNAQPVIAEIQRLLNLKKDLDLISFDLRPGLRLLVLILDEKSAVSHSLLGVGKRVIEEFSKTLSGEILVDFRSLTEGALVTPLLDVLTTACGAHHWEKVDYKTKKEKDAFKPQVHFFLGEGARKDAEAICKAAAQEIQANNLVRHLALRAGNDLGCKTYREVCAKLAAEEGLKAEFYGVAKLKELKAGAFLAVCQGSAHSDAGILRLEYRPSVKNVAGSLALVGKGIVFDTGGTNLKGDQHMFGMNQDMTGSALALACLRLASALNWPLRVTAFLAIAENAISATSYRQNDVVTAVNGKTIEIIHTDAEGRMVLADTLALVSREKPDLIMDFATLTGSCVRALGTTYSGVFTNREELHPQLIQAGKDGGERVWPFPLDEDFGECLKSDLADTKQCRLSAGPDHIEAAIFLQKFIDEEIPWVHVDLSSCENKGGLGAIPTDTTGFGPRFVRRFVEAYFSLSGS